MKLLNKEKHNYSIQIMEFEQTMLKASLIWFDIQSGLLTRKFMRMCRKKDVLR